MAAQLSNEGAVLLTAHIFVSPALRYPGAQLTVRGWRLGNVSFRSACRTISALQDQLIVVLDHQWPSTTIIRSGKS
jgi:hypothetical protein